MAEMANLIRYSSMIKSLVQPIPRLNRLLIIAIDNFTRLMIRVALMKYLARGRRDK